MEKDEAFFLATAALAITIAGFSGLVSVFHPSKMWSLQNREAVKTILQVAFGGALAALLPIFAVRWGCSPGKAIVISSGVISIYLLVVLIYQIKSLCRLLPRWLWLYSLSFLLPCIASIFAELVNAFKWESIGIHSAVIFWLLTVSCIQFFLVAKGRENETDRPTQV